MAHVVHTASHDRIYMGRMWSSCQPQVYPAPR